MYADFQSCGDELWRRFNAPKELLAWYYFSIAGSLSDLDGYKMYAEYKRILEDLFGM